VKPVRIRPAAAAADIEAAIHWYEGQRPGLGDGLRSEIETSFDRASGTYALLLRTETSESKRVGKLGRIHLRPGYYAYVGSALGPGGLHARIARHLDPTRPIHWHIDSLKRATRVVEVWYVVDPVRREHAWARAIGDMRNASIPMPGFGSSDCTCPAHLFYFPTQPKLANFKRALARTRGAGTNPIRTVRPT
jgi:Uri superfamily endonuclease